MRESAFRSVDLPQPFGPMMEVTLPAGTATSMGSMMTVGRPVAHRDAAPLRAGVVFQLGRPLEHGVGDRLRAGAVTETGFR